MKQVANERGFAMVMALGVLAVLAVLAMVVLSITVGEKKTNHSDYVVSRSFYSADAASEAGVNWIRHQASPPDIVDTLNSVFLAGSYTTLANQNRYKYDVQFIRKRYRPGWSVEYKDYEFHVSATGASAQQSASAVEVGATRLYREGY